jgi:SAM-dependent methyltransferase
MGADPQTLAFYDGEAAVYAGYAADEAELGRLAEFAALLAPGAAVLDFGCGSGWAAAELTRRGFRVSALDGSAGLAAEARARYGIEVRVARFDAFDDVALYDGVWASFSLLHDSREAMPGHLARLYRALRPGGWLYLGLKEGAGTRRDRLGRRYTYYTRPEIERLLRAAGFPEPETVITQGEGYDGSRTGLLHILARRGG